MPAPDIIPQRIISLTPSLTEILFALGQGHRVCGVTDSCDFPAEATQRPDVACWFDPDMDKLLALEPDMVLGLQTAHAAVNDAIESRGIPVVLVDPTTVDEAIADIARIGVMLGADAESETLVSNLRSRLSTVDARVAGIAVDGRPTACRILDIEDGRFHVAGPLSFQYDIITRAGGRNVTCATDEAYPSIDLEQLRAWDPQVIFSCGFDLNANPSLAHEPAWLSLEAVRSNRVLSFDCSLTCRTGPRIVDMVELLFQTLYPEA